MAQNRGVNTRLGMALFAGALVLFFASSQPSTTAAADAAWGPGIVAALPADAGAANGEVSSISCPSTGNCTAVGSYEDRSSISEGLLLTESGGLWSVGVEATLPADAATTSQRVSIESVSCAAAGTCTAVGEYMDSSGNTQGLLLTETDGTWATGVEAPLPANAVSGGDLSSVSCPSAGNCSAVGTYDDGGGTGVLLLSETAGTWAGGIQASLPPDAGADGFGFLSSVSCASAGNCTAVGAYFRGGDDFSEGGLLVTETAGSWGAGVEAPLPANARASNQFAEISSVSCGWPGICSAVGGYIDSSDRGEGLLLTETAGTWSTGAEAPLPANASTEAADAGVSLNSVSCVSPGTCAAVGDYVDSSDNGHGLLLSETDGIWATGMEAAPPAMLSSVSCSSAGNCGAVGIACSGDCLPRGVLTGAATRDSAGTGSGDDTGYGGVLLFTETGESWTTGVESSLPADASGPVEAPSVSCPSAGHCTGAAYYLAGSGEEGLLIGGAPPLVTLDVSTNGAGTVSSSPAGIGCGTACSHTYPAGTEVTLAATPAPGSAFRGWSACAGESACVTAIDADHTAITATFDPLPKACRVPNVKRKTLTAARRSLEAAACAVRSLRPAASRTIGKGRVISQTPRPGTRLMHGAKVELVVSSGVRRKVEPAERATKTARLPSLGAILPRRLPPFIAYDGPGGIWLIKPDGSDAHRVGPLGASDPVWSPDGGKILFSASGGTWTMNADGSDQRLIQQEGVGPSSVSFRGFQWSPDSKQIVFQRNDYEGSELIELENADGSNARVVTGGSDPSFSPDSGYIAFDKIGPQGSRRIYVIRPDGTGLKRITFGYGEDRPSWSPDGTRLAYHCVTQAVCETSRQRPIQRVLYIDYSDAPEYPSWSPHGDRLVFACRRDALGLPHAVCEINPHHPTPYVLYGNYKIALTNPTWNADGSKILVTVEEPTRASTQLALLSFSGGPLRMIGSGSEPDW